MCFFGAVQITIALAAKEMSQSVVDEALAIAGFAAGVLLGVFMLATFSKRANETAALVGMVSGTAVLCAVRFLTPTAWIWYSLIGAVVTFTVGITMSQLGADDARKE